MVRNPNVENGYIGKRRYYVYRYGNSLTKSLLLSQLISFAWSVIQRKIELGFLANLGSNGVIFGGSRRYICEILYNNARFINGLIEIL